MAHLSLSGSHAGPKMAASGTRLWFPPGAGSSRRIAPLNPTAEQNFLKLNFNKIIWISRGGITFYSRINLNFGKILKNVQLEFFLKIYSGWLSFKKCDKNVTTGDSFWEIVKSHFWSKNSRFLSWMGAFTPRGNVVRGIILLKENWKMAGRLNLKKGKVCVRRGLK